MKKSMLYLSIAFFTFLAGCKKDDKNCDLNAGNIVGDYVLTSVKENGVEVFNDPSYFEPCERDDIYTVLSDGSYTITDGPLVCSGSSADSGFWTLSGSTFSLDGESGTISDFSCSGFTLTIQEPGYVDVYRFAKQ